MVFLLLLLGGPSHAFSNFDYEIKEYFVALKKAFEVDGEHACSILKIKYGKINYKQKINIINKINTGNT